jgi:hypothetical protein
MAVPVPASVDRSAAVTIVNPRLRRRGFAANGSRGEGRAGLTADAVDLLLFFPPRAGGIERFGPRRLRVRMAATLLLLALTALSEAFVAGVGVTIALLFGWAIVTSPESAPSTGAPLAVGGVVALGTLVLVARGERDAPAHTVAHVKNRDAAVMTAVAFPVGAAGRVRDLLSGPTGGAEHGTVSRADRADGLVTVGLPFAAPLAVCTYMLWASLSRSREFDADRASAAVTGDPAALARALERIDGSLGDRPGTDLRRTEVAAFAVVEPGRESEASSLVDRLPLGRPFDTHPPVVERIDRLARLSRAQGLEGEHDR